MNEPGKKLFSRPALALNQNPRVTALRALYGEHLRFQEYMVLAYKPVDCPGASELPDGAG